MYQRKSLTYGFARVVVAFFINLQSTPTSRLFYIVPRFQRLIFSHCAVAHLSPPLFVPHPPRNRTLSLSSRITSSPFVPRRGSKRFPTADTSSLSRLFSTDPQARARFPLADCTVRIVIGKQISMVVLKVSALMEPSIRSTKILVPSVRVPLSLSSLSAPLFRTLNALSFSYASRAVLRPTNGRMHAEISANVGIITR